MLADIRSLTLTMGLSIVALVTTDAWAERNWEFSVGGFGGKAYHSNESMKYSDGQGGEVISGTAYDIKLNDAPTFGGKLTAWYLPRKYNWQPQVGFELDWTRFTADLHPQTVPAKGTVTIPGMELASVTFRVPQDFSVNVLAANLLFRYPIWATAEMPHGRWYPYIGAGLGAQRAHMTILNYQETSYSPAVQGFVGVKFFLVENLAIFTEWKRTAGWHRFNFQGAGTPPGFYEKFTISSNHVVGGLAIHF